MIVHVVYVKGQYNHLIARTLQDLGVQSRLLPSTTTIEQLHDMKADALVMGGGPQRVRTMTELTPELAAAAHLIETADIPLLCICVTHQLLATVYGGRTDAATKPEFGPVEVSVLDEGRILAGFKPSFTAWESHNDEIVQLPPDFRVLASSQGCKFQAVAHEKLPIFGVQFHPEVSHTTKGAEIFRNFLQAVSKQSQYP
jgi:GMP synthase (glutamine-hydrolysing)